ncbi:MAG: DUF3102 domain-containing protein [Firmicutes bacterium]|nr:DUF3102 domain-containing protein [Bacillota bacterium]
MSEEIVKAEVGKPARTLEMVTEEIRYLDHQAKRLVLGHAIEIGRRLVEAKALVPYGEWGGYIREQLNYSQSTAQNFMRIFDEYGAAQQSLFGPVAESQALGNLSYTKALALLAVPREEREDFAESVDAEHLSTRELKEAIRERDEARKAQEEAEAEAKRAKAFEKDLLNTIGDANERADKLAKELVIAKEKLKALKSRPIDVAVQEPDPAEVEKRAAELAKQAREEAAAANQVKDAMKASLEAAEKKAAEDLQKAKEKAKAEREKLEAKLKEAEAKIAAVGEADKAEAEKLRAETEQLRKQLAMSNQATVVFKLRFMAWQQAHQQMSEAFTALDEETKEKMRAAIRAQVKSWGWNNE